MPKRPASATAIPFDVFHGTSVKNGTQILSTGVFPQADYPGSWLGPGTYFWEGDRDRAVQFASRRFGANYMVLQTQLKLGRCLDMTQSKWVPFVRTAYDSLALQRRHHKDAMPRNVGRKHFLDFQVISHLCKTQGDFDTIRCAFRDGSRIYPGAGFFDLSQVMIVVRNPTMIVGPTQFVAQGI